jgi:predicted PhzF superfamily epimerase YddE/YHI9/GNAT superfamily N-acetyltransferase
MALTLRVATAADVPRLAALEAASYPADEAATPARIAYRVEHAASLFLLLERAGGELAGFVNGTLAAGELTADTMAVHDPAGATLCIHSVVIAEGLRRQGLAAWLLARYLREVAAGHPHVARAALLAHADKVALYERVGFASTGPSPVVHGGEVWLGMERPFTAADRGSVYVRANAFALPATAATGGGLEGFTGGPAGVVVLPPAVASAAAAAPLAPVDVAAPALGFPPPGWMQGLAAELNISTTAFLLPLPHLGAHHWAIRWFTPTVELPLCGHATLAAAHALWTTPGHAFLSHRPSVSSEDVAVSSDITFHSRSGPLLASAGGATGESSASVSSLGVTLVFPADPPAEAPDVGTAAQLLALQPASEPSVLSRCLGVPDALLRPVGRLAAALTAAGVAFAPSQAGAGSGGVAYIGRTRSGQDVTVEVTRDAFTALLPDVAAIHALLAPATRILTVTADGAAAVPGGGGGDGAAPRSGRPWPAASSSSSPPPYTCVSRVFMARGAFEDPVCGAAHVQLTSYWSGVKRLPAGTPLRAFQASARGGELALALAPGATAVQLGGRCLTTVVGTLAAAPPGAL